jgi:hypothetical protein
MLYFRVSDALYWIEIKWNEIRWISLNSSLEQFHFLTRFKSIRNTQNHESPQNLMDWETILTRAHQLVMRTLVLRLMNLQISTCFNITIIPSIDFQNQCHLFDHMCVWHLYMTLKNVQRIEEFERSHPVRLQLSGSDRRFIGVYETGSAAKRFRRHFIKHRKSVTKSSSLSLLPWVLCCQGQLGCCRRLMWRILDKHYLHHPKKQWQKGQLSDKCLLTCTVRHWSFSVVCLDVCVSNNRDDKMWKDWIEVYEIVNKILWIDSSFFL